MITFSPIIVTLVLERYLCIFVIYTIFRDSIMRFELRYNDEARELLLEAKECPICTNSFLNSWLECAEFVNVHKVKTVVFEH